MAKLPPCMPLFLEICACFVYHRVGDNLLSFFVENGVLVACDLNFSLCRTFCNNISLTFHPMQDSAIFCTFFPVSLINCTKYFETLAELSSGVKIGSIRAMEFVHNHSISLCASKGRSPIFLRHLPLRDRPPPFLKKYIEKGLKQFLDKKHLFLERKKA